MNRKKTWLAFRLKRKDSAAHSRSWDYSGPNQYGGAASDFSQAVKFGGNGSHAIWVFVLLDHHKQTDHSSDNALPSDHGGWVPYVYSDQDPLKKRLQTIRAASRTAESNWDLAHSWFRRAAEYEAQGSHYLARRARKKVFAFVYSAREASNLNSHCLS